MQQTPQGWPYLSSGDYIDETPAYSLDLANKLSAMAGTAPGTISDTGWVSLPLNTGFTAGSAGVSWRVCNGTVHLSGLVQRTAGSYPSNYITVGTLPVDARPVRDVGPVNSVTRNGDGQSLIVIQSNGAIRVSGTSNDRVALDAVPPYPR